MAQTYVTAAWETPAYL